MRLGETRHHCGNEGNICSPSVRRWFSCFLSKTRERSPGIFSARDGREPRMRQEPRIQTRLLALPDKPTTHLDVPSGYTDSCQRPLNAALPSLPPPPAPGHGFLCFLPSHFQRLLSLASSPSLVGTLEYLTSANLFPHPLFFPLSLSL